jgi:hypothetical protein
MNYLPCNNVVFHSPLKYKDACDRISDFVGPRRNLSSNGYKAYSKSYEGDVKGNKFDISRLINYRNSFIPVITGKIETNIHGTGSVVTVQMELNVLVVVFLTLLGISLSLTGIILLLASIESDGKIAFAAIIAFSIPLVFYYFSITAFGVECDKSTSDLKELFKAEIEKRVIITGLL